MGILKKPRNWSETLYKTYLWDEFDDKEEYYGFDLVFLPYDSELDMSNNGITKIYCSNMFKDKNEFDDTCNINRNPYMNRI